jgi:hypothetical protein
MPYDKVFTSAQYTATRGDIYYHFVLGSGTTAGEMTDFRRIPPGPRVPSCPFLRSFHTGFFQVTGESVKEKYPMGVRIPAGFCSPEKKRGAPPQT